MGNLMTEHLNALRVYKFLLSVALLLTGIFIYAGRELQRGNIPEVDGIIGIAMFLSALAGFGAVLSDNGAMYRVSYALTNMALTSWTFVLAVYAEFGISPWGRFIIFAYVLLLNLWLLPYLLTERKAREVLSRATTVAEEADKGIERRRMTER